MTSIRNWIKRMLILGKLFAVQVAVAPILIALCWGPFVHPYICKSALQKAKKRADDGDENINRDTLDLISRNEDTFVFAGNSADAISNFNVINDLPIYDYAHNYMPDINTVGQPVFGYSLIDEWFKNQEVFPEREGVIAFGWLAHQLADWYPHYANITASGELNSDELVPADEINSFSGYADSHPVMGKDFLPAVLAQQRLLNHALIELFWDIVILNRFTRDQFLKDDRVEFFGLYQNNRRCLLSDCSTRFFKKNQCHIPIEHIEPLKKDFDLVIDGMRILIELMKRTRPDLVKLLTKTEIAGVRQGEYFINRSIDKVVEGVFCISNQEISAQAFSPAQVIEAGSGTQPLAFEVVNKPATIGNQFFKLARKVGMGTMLADFKTILVHPRDSTQKVIASAIKVELLPQISKCAADRLLNNEPDGYRDFIATLLLDKKADLAGAIKKFRSAAKPVIVFNSPGEQSQDFTRHIERLFAGGNLQVRIYPAAGLTDESLKKVKAIDRSSLLFRLNGFPIDHPIYQGILDVSIDFEAPEVLESALLINCRSKGNFTSGQYHLFLTARDMSGVEADYYDILVSS
jgi:hypothetical protein